MYHYILDEDKNPVIEPNILIWGQWLGDINNKRVKLTEVRHRNFRVSTVFLGIDHDFNLVTRGLKPADYKPLIFESLVTSDDEWDEFMWRYRTWEDAEMGHAIILKKIMRSKVEFKHHRFYYL